MTERQSHFLKKIIERYSVNAEPIASATLAKDSGVSSATVRNDMAALEEEGYIVQPHTSSGRVPSEKGYLYYINNFLKPRTPSFQNQKRIDRSLRNERPLKSVAKELANLSNLAVLTAFAKNDFYYNGISNLFSQPEFKNHQEVVGISSVLDTLDKLLVELFETESDDTAIYIGTNNPFSDHCGLLVAKVKVSNNKSAVIAILGPMRMDYNKNIGLLDFAKSLLN